LQADSFWVSHVCWQDKITIMAHITKIGMKIAVWVAVLFSTVVLFNGCGGGKGDYLDPTQIGRFRSVPAINVILDTLGVAEEPKSAYEGAEDPRPIDVIAVDTDYVLQAGDIVRISIFELLMEGTPFVNDYVVTETGKISIPEVGQVHAAGLTEAQLEDEIEQILSPSILKEPAVSVILMSSQSRTFTILGRGIPSPNRYVIPRNGLRLADALAMAGGPDQFNVSYIYVTRALTGAEQFITPQASAEAGMLPQIPGSPAAAPVAPETTPQRQGDAEEEMLEIIAPHTGQAVQTNMMVITSSETATEKELEEAATPEGFAPLEESAKGETTDVEQKTESPRHVDGQWAGPVEWIYREGRWIPVRIGGQAEQPPAEPGLVGKPEAKPELLRQGVQEGFGWDEIGTGGVQQRVIKIPIDHLLGGDPMYNIVIRPRDIISVPLDTVGFYYVLGNFNNQGEIPLTGRSMTLKMAIYAAGGLGALAWPAKVEVIRRVSEKKEEIVLVDLQKISEGSQPDFFLKPKDIINVGTHPTSRWLAVLRNAFRATYGFGFVYDRNFATRDYGKARTFEKTFLFAD